MFFYLKACWLSFKQKNGSDIKTIITFLNFLDLVINFFINK